MLEHNRFCFDKLIADSPPPSRETRLASDGRFHTIRSCEIKNKRNVTFLVVDSVLFKEEVVQLQHNGEFSLPFQGTEPF